MYRSASSGQRRVLWAALSLTLRHDLAMTKSRPYSHRKAVEQAKLVEGGVCAVCLSSDRTHGHHLTEYSLGGAATSENIVVLCETCHKRAHRGDIDLIRIIF